MARARQLEKLLAELAALRSEPDSEASIERLRSVLASGPSHAVALAAEICRDAGLEALAPALSAAFRRLLEHAEKRDPGCAGKTAIAEALDALEADAEPVFLRGVRFVQMEPVWGGKADTAAGLRGACLRGLYQLRHPDAAMAAAELLADPEKPARIAAARALGHYAGEPAAPLLRLKLAAGDEELDVQAECLLALLRIDAQRGLDIASDWACAADGERAAVASLALGESRLPGAVAVLKRAFERAADPERGRAALLALSSLRSDEAIELLLGWLASEPGPTARDVLSALEVHRDDGALVERIRRAAAAREDDALVAALARHFPGTG